MGNYDIFIISSDTFGHIYNQKDAVLTVIVCVNGTTQSCGSDIGECVAGTKTCAGGVWGACVGETGSVAEICDGLDNDCDNSTDENLIAPPNSNQAGVCAGSRKTCSGAAGWVDDYLGVANNEFPAEISCDGLDNNCDGTTDEGCVCVNGATQSCGSNVGECQAGIQTCAAGSWGACVGKIAPSVEICNDSKDNDCDNDTDCADSDCSGDLACVAVTCPDGICDIAGGECATCTADCACVNLGDPGCDLTFKSVCCDNATTENLAGEVCDVADGWPPNMDLNGKTCNYFGYTGGTLGCRWDCFNYDPSSCTGVPATCGNNVCDAGENCLNCPTECCPPGCPDFCFSEGYECGTQTLCGTPTNCGSCTLPETCNMSGICVLPSLAVSIQSPQNGLEFTDGDLVDFNGFVLGGTPNYVYEWSSDKEVLSLSSERVFSSRNLSVNVHTITLKVTDDNGIVGQDSVNIIVQPVGILSVRIILERTEFFLDSFAGSNFGYFVGSSVVSGGTGAYTYQWNSNLAGNFSTDKLAVVDFSTVPAWTLGAHTIKLTIKDGAGNTAEDTKIINITDKTILSVYPNDGEHFTIGQPITFSVTSVVGYGLFSATWVSDIEGGTIGTTFAFQKNDLSIGLHAITLKVIDTSGDIITKTFQIQINPVPAICNEDWNCSEWSLCVLGSRTRVCTDNNFCGTVNAKPDESESCIVPASSFDWRDNLGDWMTPIRNQGACGSCWAFATLGSVEAKYNIQNSDLTLDENLSEQDLISCSYAGSCSGGNPDLAMHYLKTVGINNETCFSNQYADASCSNKCAGWQNNIWNIDGSFSGKNVLVQIMKDRLINDGPFVVAMNNDPLSANSWNSTNLSCIDDTSLNHAVVIVGYDDAGGYWIVRNSWGVNWPNFGDDGYFEVIYGECGIESEMSYPNKVLSP